MRSEVDGCATEFEVTGAGRPVLLLHGFPDSGNLWRHQVPQLSVAGFQLIVPDLRGYGHSAKPTDVESYGLLQIARDVIGVLDQLGIDRAHFVGHDWGAALSWVLATLSPERVDHLVALSVGHPAAFAEAGLTQR
ncbi:MAG TPA: alpha/beta hydrolase, partial [Chloroflexota bacterium]